MSKKVTQKPSTPWTNMMFASAVAVIVITVAYFLLVHLPKQQKTSLRKQAYELCKKEWDEGYEKISKSLDNLTASGAVTSQDNLDQMLLVQGRKDGFLAECVEKRLSEYQK